MAGRLDQITSARKKKIQTLQAQGINPFAYSFDKKHSVLSSRNKLDKTVQTAARIIGLRGHGNLFFADIKDETGKIQILLSKKELTQNWEVVKKLDIGDIVGVKGKVFITKAGEVTIQTTSLTLLSKTTSPLPDSWYGLKDKESRFRRRYLDLILNDKAFSVLMARWQIEKELRKFLWGEGYHEVETPVLQNLYGGTNATPFTTHLKALDQKMYLRIAPELYLKRLVIGGFDKVFEVARNFRNEGIDQTHQPEFTMVEFYEAYADYNRIMELTESMVKHIAKKLNQSLELAVGKHKINLSGKWEKITIDDALKRHLSIDWDTVSDKKIQSLLAKHQIKVLGEYSRDKALFTLYDHLVTPQLIKPTWVIDYPRAVSPLSKLHRSKPDRVERFEGYVGGKEIFDGWSEIINPDEQRSRFQEEQKNLKSGDAEAMPLDEDFLESLTYACPPLGGIGFGVDRLVMFLTNTWSIKETIAFPLLRPENN